MPTTPDDSYDAIVIGARAAGATTGMLLARAGLRVLIVDRGHYGADTLSTHALMRAGVLQLHRWGLLDELVVAGTPPIRHTTIHAGGDLIVIAIEPSVGVDALYAPRRTILDPILVDAAVAAGADVRYGVAVKALEHDEHGRVTGISGLDEDGRRITATARIIVGADGRGSNVARWVAAPDERVGHAAGAVAYGYWTGIDADGYEWYFRSGAAAGAIPTNHGQTCVFVGTTPERFRRELVPDAARGFSTLLADAAPELVDRLAHGRLSTPLRRFAGLPGHLRRAWGPGWALVGDAGYFKDPITAHGLTDALRDAELLSNAIIAALANEDDEAALLGTYQATRDRLSADLFTVTDAIASYAWSAEEVGILLRQLSSAMADEVEALVALSPT